MLCLQDVVVLDLARRYPAAFTSMYLADFGAEVIKVEAPGKGDELRAWRYVPPETGTSLWWYSQARNKKSITLDLRRPEGQGLLRRLAAVSDAMIENFRPGTLERWGLSYPHLREVNPRLVMVSISGYGQTGPYRSKPGFASTAEGLSGIRYLTGYPDRPPVRVGISLGDHVASMYAVFGLLTALYHRDARGAGAGQQVDVALYESMFSFMESLLPEYDVAGRIWERTGAALASAVPTNSYPTADGRYVIIGGNNDSLYRRLMKAVGRDDLAEDPRLQSNVGRLAHRELIDGAIEEWTRRHTLEECVGAIDAAEVPVGPMYTAAEIVKDPQYLEREMIIEQEVPGLGKVKYPGIVPKLSETPGSVEWSGPALGRHNQDVYQGLLGLSDEEYGDLTQRGVI